VSKIALYYSHPFETGGVEKTMYERAKLLKKLKYKVTFVVKDFDHSPIDMADKWSEVADVLCYDLAKEEHFDIAIYDSIYNNQRLDADMYELVINGNLIDGGEFFEGGIPYDRYIAVSEDCARQFKERIGKECIVIPNLIDEKEIIKLSKEKYDLPKAKHNFVVVARLSQEKGFDRLERILEKIHKETKDYQLVVVGSCYMFPQYGEEIQRRYSKYNVTFVGKQDNPYKYMRNADITIVPSNFESQCMVLDESLIVGTPVVATDFDTAVKKLDGKNGYTFKKNLSDFDVNKLLNFKGKFEYHYPTYEKEWKQALKPFKKKDYKFSIIIPNYNNAEYLEKCLDSVLKQTYKKYEIIFIDDMSTDNSLEIARRKLTGDNHKIIPLKQKRLNGGSRNVGIVEADSDYIMCIDSDDWLTSNDILERINKSLRNEDVMFLGYSMLDANGERAVDTPEHTSLDQAFKQDTCAIWTKVVKTEILKNCLFPEGTLAEDKVHHYRLIDMCSTFKDFPYQTHMWNRLNTHSTTSKDSCKNVEWETGCIKHIAEMYKYTKTTRFPNRKAFVENKIKQQIENVKKGIFLQI